MGQLKLYQNCIFIAQTSGSSMFCTFCKVSCWCF